MIPVVLILLATRMRIAWGYDSLMYASTRRYFERTGHLDLMSLFPPGLPLLIFVTGTGLGLLAYNCLVAWANTLAVHRLTLEVTGSRAASLAVQLWVGVSLATLSVFSFVWSEPTFCLLVNVALLMVARMWTGSVTRRSLLPLILAVNVAGLFRYAVLPLIVFAGAAVAVPLFRRSHPARALGQSAAVTALCSCSTLALVVTNVLNGEAAMGPRMPSTYHGFDVLDQLCIALGQMALNIAVPVPAVVGLLAVAAFLVAVGSWIARQPTGALLRNPGTPVAAWTVGYVGFMVLSELNNDLNWLDFRLLSPVAAALATLMATVLLAPLRRFSPFVRRAASGAYLSVVGALAVVWVLGAITVGIPTWLPNQPEVDRQVTMVVARDVPMTATLSSDDPWRLAWATQRDLVRGVPDSGPYPGDTPEFTPRNQASYARPGDYVVLFISGPRSGLVPVEVTRTFGLYRLSSG